MTPMDPENKRRAGFVSQPQPMMPPPMPNPVSNFVPGTYNVTQTDPAMPPPGMPQKPNRKPTSMGV